MLSESYKSTHKDTDFYGLYFNETFDCNNTFNFKGKLLRGQEI